MGGPQSEEVEAFLATLILGFRAVKRKAAAASGLCRIAVVCRCPPGEPFHSRRAKSALHAGDDVTRVES